MTPAFMLAAVINPGLKFLVPIIGAVPEYSPAARVMLLAIAGQESAFKERRQILDGGRFGAANSYWMQEASGGVAAVLRHPKAGPWARTICAALDIPSDQATVWAAMAWNDHLAVAMARLNLWMIPAALPALGDEKAAYAMYVRQWAPGKPDETRWSPNYQAALAACGGAAAAAI
jgi:hypothetical protein